MRRRRPKPSAAREIFGALALVCAIFVSILALPIGRTHRAACAIVSTLTSRPGMPCGLAALEISIDTDRSPFFVVKLRPPHMPFRFSLGSVLPI